MENSSSPSLFLFLVLSHCVGADRRVCPMKPRTPCHPDGACDEESLVFRDCLYCPTVLGGLSEGLRGYLNLLYSQTVLNLYAVILYFAL